MTDAEHQIAAARAAADRQRKLADDAFAKLVEDARQLLATNGPTDVWAILSQRVARELECVGKYQRFAVEMLVTAAVRRAEEADQPGPRL